MPDYLKKCDSRKTELKKLIYQDWAALIEKIVAHVPDVNDRRTVINGILALVGHSIAESKVSA